MTGYDDGLPDTFVMVPPGYRGPLPEGIPTFEEWSLISERKREAAKHSTVSVPQCGEPSQGGGGRGRTPDSSERPQ
jgi:hypothetical protein